MEDQTPVHPPITLRRPSKYTSLNPDSAPKPSSSTPPALDWIIRTWTISNSTLSMWKSARNVRIIYTTLPPTDGNPSFPRIDDCVEYEKNSGPAGGKVKSIAGIDTAASLDADKLGGDWDWRGKGWLKFVTSHWEILGWGERKVMNGGGGDGGEAGVERWMVTWFAPTLFTKEGIDVYCDRKEGPSKALLEEIMAVLKKDQPGDVVKMCEKEMEAVEILLPWGTR